MGVHIIVREGVNGPTHTGWSPQRSPSDRDFIRWMASLPRKYAGNDPWSPAFQPIDIPRWRKALPHHATDIGRFRFLLDLLDTNQNLWIHLSW